MYNNEVTIKNNEIELVVDALIKQVVYLRGFNNATDQVEINALVNLINKLTGNR